MRTFFDFMRTAYQVNDSFNELSSVLNANSQIDWSALAKINLDLITEENTSEKLNTKLNDKSIETDELNNPQPGTSSSLEKIRSSRSSRKLPKSKSSQSRVRKLDNFNIFNSDFIHFFSIHKTYMLSIFRTLKHYLYPVFLNPILLKTKHPRLKKSIIKMRKRSKSRNLGERTVCLKLGEAKNLCWQQ